MATGTINRPHSSNALSDEDLMMPTEDCTSWVDKVIQAVAQEPENWDGYGGSAASEDSLKGSRCFLDVLFKFFEISKPYVTPTRSGGVLFLWQTSRGELEVQINGLSAISYVYSPDETNDIANEFDLFVEGGDPQFVEVVAKFFQKAGQRLAAA